MKASTKIDFEPSLFGDVNQKTIEMPLEKSKIRIEPILIFVFSAIFIVILLFAISKSTESREDDIRRDFLDMSKKYPGEITLPPPRRFVETPKPKYLQPSDLAPSRAEIPTYSNSGWCHGDEEICTIATTKTLTDTLHKIIAAVPQTESKQYRIQLSITPIEEEKYINMDRDEGELYQNTQ